MNILGIACFYHDASACLVRDGQVIAAAEEERFTRQKHCIDFPRNAIRYCLEAGGIGVGDLDYVGFYEKPFLKMERILSTHLDTYPRSFIPFVKAIPLWLNQKLRVPSIIRKELGYQGEILFIEHHLAHAASTFLCSPFEEAAILTVDGTGEWATTTRGRGRGAHIELSDEVRFPHSLGLLYSAVTAYLGFQVNDGEGKVMGLAPYGQPRYHDQFRERIISFNHDGSFRLNLDFFAYHYKLHMVSDRFVREFGPPRRPEGPMEKRHEDMAATLQLVLEDVLLAMARDLHQRTGLRALCLAGGVALNSVANGRILRETPFEEIFIQPAAGDGGTSVGTALYIDNVLLGNPRRYVMRDAYLGPAFSSDEIRDFLGSRGIPAEYLEDEKLVPVTARLLADQKIVGWLQGRMELGPRALGNRSILTDPRRPEMKEILNARVKHREGFRPFAPTVLLEESRRFFDLDVPSPFMLLVGDVWPDKRALVPAITHVDGTARVQTVTREENPLYYDLIQEFGRLTGVPVILNTSFNIRGEPIVCTPEDAYHCFANTQMDYLVLGNYLVRK